MRFGVCLLVAVLMSGQLATGRIYTRCGLTLELIRLKVNRTFIGNWVCLVLSESFLDSSLVTERANGGKGLGLFQINSKDWCTFGKPGGRCNLKCEALLDDDIEDDVKCAKKAIDELGFQAWPGWKRNCYRQPTATKMPDC